MASPLFSASGWRIFTIPGFDGGFPRLYDFKTNNPRDVLAIFSPPPLPADAWEFRDLCLLLSTITVQLCCTRVCVSLEKKEKKKKELDDENGGSLTIYTDFKLFRMLRKINKFIDQLDHGDRKFNETIIDVVTLPKRIDYNKNTVIRVILTGRSLVKSERRWEIRITETNEWERFVVKIFNKLSLIRENRFKLAKKFVDQQGVRSKD